MLYNLPKFYSFMLCLDCLGSDCCRLGLYKLFSRVILSRKSQLINKAEQNLFVFVSFSSSRPHVQDTLIHIVHLLKFTASLFAWMIQYVNRFVFIRLNFFLFIFIPIDTNTRRTHHQVGRGRVSEKVKVN